MQKTEELEIYKRISTDFKVVFDVGSRDDLDYHLINPSPVYHLFEPNVDALNSIKNKVASIPNNNGIIINEFGLSDETKDDCVYFKNIQSFKPHWCVDSVDSGERYSLKRLDDYVLTKGIAGIDFLKIDVEALDYNVILGGLKTIKDENKVSYIQVEYSGGVRQYVELLDNFDFYWMIEPVLLAAINEIKVGRKEESIEFNVSLLPLNDELITFIDEVVSPSGNGGNIFGINKHKELMNLQELIFKVVE